MNADDESSQQAEERERIFKRFDANGDGKISLSELGAALKELGSSSDEEVQAMLSDIDSDKDGDINFMEYLDFVEKTSD